MPSPRAQPTVTTQLKDVTARLDRNDRGRATGEDRLALLRQQAELGDRRDALADARRRGLR